MQIDDFILQLSQANPRPSVTNPWRGTTLKAKLCRNNLEIYLNYFQKNTPEIILIGEALGYRGGLHTGIPFSSQYILNQHKSHPLISEMKNYNDALISESTATIAWNLFMDTGTIPLCWNIYPFHPHRKYKPYSNRAPNMREMKYGLRMLKILLTIYSKTTVVSVGGKAHKMLSQAGISGKKIRHPSYGGKKEFCKQFTELCNNSYLKKLNIDLN